MKIDKSKTLKILAFVLLFLSIVGFIVCAVINKDKLDAPYVRALYDDVIVNLEIPARYENSIKLYNGNYEQGFQSPKAVKTDKYNIFVNSVIQRKKVGYLSLLIPSNMYDEIVSNISGVGVYVGLNFYGIDKKTLMTLPTQSYTFNKAYKELHLDSYIRKVDDAPSLNYRGNLNAIKVALFSFVYQWQLYLIPYVLLFISVIIFSKEQYEFKLNYKWSLLALLAFAFIIRMHDCAKISLWTDELCSMTYSIPMEAIDGWGALFHDPGNPPLYYLLVKLWMLFWGTTEFSARMLSVVIGTASIWSIWYFVKSRVGNGRALLVAFMSTFCIYNLAYSQDCRTYILAMFLIPLGAKYLFDVLEKKDMKSYVMFTILGALLLNAHYYSIIFVMSSFVYGTYYILKNSDNKADEYLNFFLSHVVMSIFALPFVLMVFLKHALMNGEFNDWIPKLTSANISETIDKVFGGKYVLTMVVGFVLISILFIKNKVIRNELVNEFTEKHQQLIIYCAFVIAFQWIVVLGISLFRPIMYYFYFSTIATIYLTLVAGFISIDWKNKVISNVAMLLLLIVFTSNQIYHNDWKIKRTFNWVADYVAFDVRIHDYMDNVAYLTDVKTYSYFFSRPNVNWAVYNGPNTEALINRLEKKEIENPNRPRNKQPKVYYYNHEEMFHFRLIHLDKDNHVNMKAIVGPDGYKILRIIED